MSGKLAWSLGIALALVGILMFAWGFLMRDKSALEKAKNEVPSNIPSRSTNEQVAQARRGVVSELASLQSSLVSAAGANERAVIFADYLNATGNFATQIWPTQKEILNGELSSVELKRPSWTTQGEMNYKGLIGEPDKWSKFDPLIGPDANYSANNFRLGKLAATAIREWVVVAVREAKALRAESDAKFVFEVVTFDFNGDNARFSESAPSSVYGEQDPYVRRNFLVEYVADPVLADRINRVFLYREAKPPFVRAVRVSMVPSESPTGGVKDISASSVKDFLSKSVVGKAIRGRVIPGGGERTWQELAEMEDKNLEEWLTGPGNEGNLNAVRTVMDLDPEFLREAVPTRVKLWLQLVELKPVTEAPLLQPLEKATEGLPPEAAPVAAN